VDIAGRIQIGDRINRKDTQHLDSVSDLDTCARGCPMISHLL
jgi:hypothetical protein